jgi:hypothetical protein
MLILFGTLGVVSAVVIATAIIAGRVCPRDAGVSGTNDTASTEYEHQVRPAAMTDAGHLVGSL